MVKRGIVVPEYEEVIEEDNITSEEPQQEGQHDFNLDYVSPQRPPE